MNFIGVAATVLSVVTFAIAYQFFRHRSLAVRICFLCGFALLSVPSVWFAIYYLHILGEHEWFYNLRSWPGSEFLVLFLGGAGGVFATLMPRLPLGLPLSVVMALAVAPYIKPLIGPLPDNAFREQWRSDICIQSTPSTCGPASVTTILQRFGIRTTERGTARAAFSYGGGTEAWYLARYVRHCGLTPRFEFRSAFTPAVGLPALVGVRLGSIGHFIAVLDFQDDQVTFADPLYGEEHLSLAEFQRRYVFTGFHMVIQRP
ncbi:MAG TPA: cysteine peptidase family C39 domain-containing protein [Chthoniobacter sp.]|nr:cysteine peptidase family C39 domain-containing protein [Chthoniobacter sp.]